MKPVSLSVNGESMTAVVSPRTQLAELLRDHFELTGTHLGCEHGVCGACTVLVDDVPVRSCISYAHAVEEARVLTVEGLAGDELGQALREAFSRHHALQCGFCTPGFLMTLTEFLQTNPDPSEAAVRDAVSGNLCRCTGYENIVQAALSAARTMRSTGADSGGGRE